MHLEVRNISWKKSKSLRGIIFLIIIENKNFDCFHSHSDLLSF